MHFIQKSEQIKKPRLGERVWTEREKCFLQYLSSYSFLNSLCTCVWATHEWHNLWFLIVHVLTKQIAVINTKRLDEAVKVILPRLSHRFWLIIIQLNSVPNSFILIHCNFLKYKRHKHMSHAHTVWSAEPCSDIQIWSTAWHLHHLLNNWRSRHADLAQNQHVPWPVFKHAKRCAL